MSHVWIHVIDVYFIPTGGAFDVVAGTSGQLQSSACPELETNLHEILKRQIQMSILRNCLGLLRED